MRAKACSQCGLKMMRRVLSYISYLSSLDQGMAVSFLESFLERGDFRHGNDAGFRAYIFDPPRPFPRLLTSTVTARLLSPETAATTLATTIT